MMKDIFVGWSQDPIDTAHDFFFAEYVSQLLLTDCAWRDRALDLLLDWSSFVRVLLVLLDGMGLLDGPSPLPRLFHGAVNPSKFLLTRQPVRSVLSILLEDFLLQDKVLVKLWAARSLLQVADPKVHVDAWLGELQRVHQVGRVQEASLLLSEFLALRLDLQPLLKLEQLRLELLGVREHIQSPPMVLDFLLHNLFPFAHSLCLWE